MELFFVSKIRSYHDGMNIFDELLNQAENVSSADEAVQDISLGSKEDVDVSPPSLKEVKEAIAKLKNNKAPGVDGIPAELLKHGGPELTKRMHEIISLIWSKEELPDGWNYAVICPLHKKGDPLVCGNYRGISLLNVAYKILSNILYSRLVKYTEEILGNYQCGFRPGRSTVNRF